MAAWTEVPWKPGNPPVPAPFVGPGLVYNRFGVLNTAPTGATVSQLIAGDNITLSPPEGTGVVTVTSTGGGVTQLIAGTNITLDPTDGLGAVTISSTGGGGGGSAGDSFNIMLASDWTYPGVLPAFETVTNWRDTLDPVCTANSPKSIFSNVTDGVLDLAAGTYTCGKAGLFLLTITQGGSGAGYFAINGYTPANILSQFGDGSAIVVPLEVGDVVTIWNQGYSSPVEAIEYEAVPDPNDPESYLPEYKVCWGLVALGGGSAPSTTISDSFQIMLTEDFVWSGPGYENVPGWRDTVDVATCPGTGLEFIYNNVSNGTLDLAAGTYTVATAGKYLGMVGGGSGTIAVNGNPTCAVSGTSTFLLNLAAGDVCTFAASYDCSQSIQNFPPVGEVATYWGMSFVNPVQAGSTVAFTGFAAILSADELTNDSANMTNWQLIESSPSFNETTGVFTAPKSTMYQINVKTTLDGPGSIDVWKAGSVFIQGSGIYEGQPPFCSYSCVVRLTAGEQLSLRGYLPVTVSRTVEGSLCSFWSVYALG